MAISNTPKIGSISFWQSLVAKSHVKIFVAITDTKRLTDCPKNYDEILRKQKTLLSWPNRLFKKDLDKTASAARILSPNRTRRPLPCLLFQSFFYAFNRQHSFSSTLYVSLIFIRVLTLLNLTTIIFGRPIGI